MPTPPADKPAGSPAVTLLPSPREAAARAAVYRRNRRDPPRDRLLRVLALAGTLLVHLLVLVGIILGPAYELPEGPGHRTEALHVRLIEKAPEPPPPPPVRGLPPRQVGPRHRGTQAAANRPRNAQAATATAAAAAKPSAARAAAPQAVAADTAPAPVKPAPVAAPPRPLSLPRPRPAPALQPVPVSGEPPQVALDTPPASKPVPPKFQPEPVRRPQAEGTQPMPTPPSLAMPEMPAQAPPKVEASTIALDAAPPKSDAPPSAVPVERPPSPAAAPAAERPYAPPTPPVAPPAVREAPAAPRAPLARDARGLPDWGALIEQANLRGPLGQLAQNAALRERDGQTLVLVLQPLHMHLAVEPIVGQMEDRISQALGERVRLRFTSEGSGTAETPAARAANARGAAQAAAEQSIEEDPLVQSLKREFGARVVPQSIKPVGI